MSRPGFRYEPLFDVDPVTGVSIEVFYADRRLETFGRGVLLGFGSRAGVGSRPVARQLGHSRRAIRRIVMRCSAAIAS
jgi:hypothetical protein